MFRKLFSRQLLFSDLAILVYLALFKLLLHVLTSGQYGYHRDEFYYIAVSKHLDFGYVDFPPLVPLIAAATRFLVGDSLLALRFFPAVAGSLIVLLTGLIVRELGGCRFAQILATVAAIVAPVILGVGSTFSVDSFNMLSWVLGSFVIILFLKREDPKMWLLFGLIAGIGLMIKVSMLYFGFALFLGLLFTPNRKQLATRWPWLGGLIAFLIFLPYIIWQIVHGWPTLEFLRYYAGGKTYPVSPLGFLLQQILTMHPLTLPIWLSGLYYLLFSKEGKRYRIFGLMYLILYVVFTVQKAKFYFLSPMYPVLFASGALVIERFIRLRNWNRLKPALISLLIIGGIITAPFAIPLLPVETFIRYSSSVGGDLGVKQERHEIAQLPQHFADRFGWENMVATVARVYQSLSPEEQKKVAIFTGNYGEAGAIDFFGGKYNLPRAISGHNNYYLFGPGDYSGEIVIFIGVPIQYLKRLFDEVEQAAIIRCKYCMPYENNLPVYVCRRPKFPITEVWPQIKHYD
jgi:hypothetical protein